MVGESVYGTESESGRHHTYYRTAGKVAHTQRPFQMQLICMNNMEPGLPEEALQGSSARVRHAHTEMKTIGGRLHTGAGSW